jgi:hypothetical protein
VPCDYGLCGNFTWSTSTTVTTTADSAWYNTAHGTATNSTTVTIPVTIPAGWVQVGYTTEDEVVYSYGQGGPIYRYQVPVRHYYDAGGARIVEQDPASRAAIEARAERQRRLRDEREQQRLLQLAASERAEATMLLMLNAEQRADWEAYRCFVVTAQSGRRYRINRGTMSNVELLGDAGEVVEWLCAHPELYGDDDDGALPVEDVMLAQMLALCGDEAGFRLIANIEVQRGPGGYIPSGVAA